MNMVNRMHRIFTPVAALAFAAAIVFVITPPARAQTNQLNNGMGDNSSMNTNPEMNRAPSIRGEESPDSIMKPPMGSLEIREPLTGTMMVSPPYGNAPLRVGFIIVANDPENIGFLTYQWNFGDGTVSSLPPVKFIPHTYKKPGNYVCSLTLKTADGRSKTIFAGVVVRRRIE
jgi:PKD domain-containing protein